MQVGNVIFSDYRIISSFLKACDEDVLKLTCGKTRGGAVEGAKHSQGLTIDLSQKPDSTQADLGHDGPALENGK